MLTATKLIKRYSGQRAVDAVGGIDLDIEDGQFVSIVGRSGSGKSTLLAMLGGLCRPTGGSIVVRSTDQWALKSNLHADFRSQEIGFVFQFASLLPSLRALDNVALPALVAGSMSEKEAYARARMLLEDVGLGTRYDFYPGELSGGEQRRVAIARALINSPKLLLADEPTADLDEETEEEILNLLIDIQHAQGLTLIVVTHNATIAERADRVIEMKSGLIVGDSLSVAAGASPLDRTRGLAPAATGYAPAGTGYAPLGAGIERFIGQLVLLTVPLIALLWCVNFVIREFETRALEQQSSARQALEDMAMTGLRSDVKDVTFGANGTYDVSIYLRNTLGDKPLYVLSPTLRGFIQIGSSWQEVPMRPDAASPKQRVLKVTGEQIYHFILEPKVSSFAELLPYYMHVRFTNEMLVSPSSQPKNDLVERADSYYVYLKPHNAKDDLILKKMKFPGKPPVWIPMPPH